MTTVLQIIPSMNAGGAEQACVDITAGLAAAGHRAIVVSSGGALMDKVLEAGGEPVIRDVASKSPVTILTNAMWLKRFIRKHRVDIVHARSRAPAWSALIACRGTGRYFVTTFHASYKFSTPVKKFYNSVMARGDRIIAISSFIAAHIKKTYPMAGDRVRTIPRGIDLDRFRPEKVHPERCAELRKLWGLGENQRVILCPARLSPIKGHTMLIEAMALLPPAYNDVVAIIVGDDQGRTEYRRELETLIAQRKLQDRVKLVPHCRDMPAAYKIASLAVATSKIPEGLGRVPIEAMSMGIPIIATNIGGFTETISHGRTGWLVPVGDARKLAGGIVHVFSKQLPEKREEMLKAAMQHVRVNFDKSRMVADTLAVYDELMKKS